jgi:hypothetical protein
MRNLCCSLFLLIIVGVSMGQTPGYMGKRFTISYEQLTGINYFNLFGFNQFNNYRPGQTHVIDEARATWNYIPKFNIDYVMKRNMSRGFSISPISQPMYFDDQKVDNQNLSIYIQDNNYVNSAKLTGATFGLYVKYFKRGWIAPLGDYYKLEFLLSSYKIKSFEKQTVVYEQTKRRLEPYTSVGFVVTHGVSRIIFNRLIINFGISMGYRLNFFNPALEINGNSTSSENLLILKEAAHYWHGQNIFFNLNTGIGYLVF